MLSGKSPRYSRLVLKMIAVLSMAIAVPAAAHHSFALYDMSKTMSAKAVIKDFHWGAPHSSASFVIKDGSGPGRILTLQGAAPARMMRAGFNPKDMHRGMNVEIAWHPLRNGEGGSLMAIKFPDGRTFKDDEYDFTRENPATPPDAPSAPGP